jgi:hypothetical protein
MDAMDAADAILEAVMLHLRESYGKLRADKAGIRRGHGGSRKEKTSRTCR